MPLTGSLFRPLDALLLLSVAAGSCWGFLGFRMEAGARAVVYVDGEKFGRYELSARRREVEVRTRIGPVLLEIGDGSARVLGSPCPNRQCMRTGPLRQAHSEAICMPARLVVAVEGASDVEGGKGPDAVTY